MDLELVILGASLVLLTGVAAVGISARAGLPSLLLYLAIGLAIGEAGLGLQVENLDHRLGHERDVHAQLHV